MRAEQGEGTKLSGGVGIAAGAIMPPPVNMQIEEEFIAHPPWNAAVELTARTSVDATAAGLRLDADGKFFLLHPECDGGVGRTTGRKLWRALTRDERGTNRDSLYEATGGGLVLKFVPVIGWITTAGCVGRRVELLVHGG